MSPISPPNSHDVFYILFFLHIHTVLLHLDTLKVFFYQLMHIELS
jgi:hypothetical protein